jgi:multidrug efflux pump subunit AcrB
VKQYTTYANENVGSAIVEVREDYDVNEVLDQVRSKVDAVSTFPADAEEPVIAEMLLRDPVMLLYVSGDMSERRLKQWAEEVKDEIQQIPDVSQVDVFGARDFEINIEVSEQRLRQHGLRFDQVAEAVRNSNLNLAGGTIRTRGEEIRVRTVGRKYTGRELSSIVVKATPEGDLITLDRLATIDDGFTEDPIRAGINGERAVMLIVSKTQEEDALRIANAVTAYVEQRREQLPLGANLEILYDNTDMLRDRIDLLLRNGAYGLLIVFLALWVFLNIRLSFWAGMGIPISLAGAIAIVWGLGGTINMISLFALIMVLGIVVDDAIVVGEAIYVQRKNGLPPLRAAVAGVSEVGMPVVAAVTTTIVAFTPLMFVGGIMGKFIAVMPVVVIACLAISLVECLILLPAHLNDLPDPNGDPSGGNALTRRLSLVNRTTSRGLEWFVRRVYAPFLSRALYWRYITLCTALAVLMVTVGLIRGNVIQFEVFPEVDGFIATATVEMPNGTPPHVTAAAVERIEEALLRLDGKTRTRSGDPLLEDRLAIVGQTLGDIPQNGPHLGAVQAILLTSEKRGIHSQDIMVAWEKEIGTIAGIKSLTFAGLQAGPPGAPIEVWIQGNDMNEILAASEALMGRLRELDGVYQIRSDFSPGKNEIRLTLKPEARTLGITVSDLARQVYSGYYGEEILRLQRGRDDIRVKVRYTADERSRLADLEQVRIRTRSGREVPLLSVADVGFAPGYSEIVRTDGLRRVAVSADVDTNRANANEIFDELTSHFFPKLQERHPELRIDLQGEKKKMRESFDSLYVGFPLAVLGIFIIVSTMFRSYLQPFVILVTVPFGIIGGIFGHLVLGYNMSIMSIFGFVALAGVVVNDAIVLIERVNENFADGMPFFEAIIAGGARRFRAIVLTTVSTVGGLTPLILETDFQARFLIPMAISIAAGVAFATLLTLVMIPGLLVILSDFRLLAHRLRHGQWPRRLEVEPASQRRELEPEVPPPGAPAPAGLPVERG